MSVLELLEKGWAQNAYARNSSGKVCEPSDPEAVCWCLVGAIKATLQHQNDRSDAYIKVKKALGTNYITAVFNFNDTHTKEEVLELVRKVGLC